jgi:hypothetical protein
MVRTFDASFLRKIIGYSVQFDGVGLPKTNDDSRGFCSQFAIFEKQEKKSLEKDKDGSPKKIL